MVDFTYYIDTDNAAGGRDGTTGNPYNAIDEAWEARQGDADGGNTVNFLCKGATADATVDFDNFGSAGTGDCNVYWGTWDDADNEGKSDTAVAFDTNFYAVDDTTSGVTVLVEIDPVQTTNEVNFTIEDIQVKLDNTINSSSPFVCNIGDGGNADCNVISRKVKWVYVNGSGDTFPRVFRLRAGCKSFLMENCIVVGGQSQVNQSGSWYNGNTAVDLYNNAFLYATDGSATATYTGVSAGFTVNSENNLILFGDGAATGTFNTEDYNASDFAGDRGTNGVAAVSGDLTTSTRGDTLNPTPTGSPGWETAGRTGASIPTEDLLGDARNTSGNTAIGPVRGAGEGPSGGIPLSTVYHARHHNKAL